MTLSEITPVILTYNEAPNLQRCLDRLTWASDVVVVDSGSSDETAAIAASFPNVRLIVRPFDDHTSQWNFGLDQALTEWVLSLDADYVLRPEWESELMTLQGHLEAYAADFRYLICGQPLRSCLYPPRTVLFKRTTCRYVQDGHTQLLNAQGAVGRLSAKIDHDDRKPLSRWLASQEKYARLEAEKLASKSS